MDEKELDQTRNKFIKSLMELKDAKRYSSGSEITIYCPRCKHLHPNSSPHLYIGLLDPNSFPFDCKHCQYQGIISPKFLEEINLYTPEFVEFIKTLNRQTGYRTKKVFGDEIINDLTISNQILKRDQFKIDYISERTGIDFNNEKEIQNHKIILDLNKFLQMNKIDLGDRYESYLIKELSENAFGFLSYNKNVINLRNISSDRLKRYTNIKIDPSISYPFLYLPPVEVDVLTKSPHVVVSEGSFDILCIKKRFFPEDANNIIFGAVGSSGSYQRAIKKLIYITCFIGSNITIFSDSDVKIDSYKKALSGLLNNHKIKVIYNTINKDFGHINLEVKFKTFKL